jgi:DNA-binding response OmpR family regulator
VRRTGAIGLYAGLRRPPVPWPDVRLLVVEDEVDLAEALAKGLRREGYAVDVAHDARTALSNLAVNPYDLVCLDLNLPDLDGREVCRRLRVDPAYAPEPDEPAPRVLMLTARDALDDRVAGLDEGADDYLVKPFAFSELTARVRSLLRRDAGRSGAVLRVGDLQLDTARFEATRGGRLLDLTAKEFALLRYFMGNAGRVLSQEHLLEHVWDENADPFTNTVRVTVGTLRRKLAGAAAGTDGTGGSGADADQPIETVVGAGYRLRIEP